ncbi:MAG: lipoate--protein ligase [Desulfococcaceae bacterium]
MELISNQDFTDPRVNLALEEYCLRHKKLTGDYLLFYVNEPSIIIGRNQNTIEEINADYVREKGIHVVRRVSGGGAVYHDLGNLNFSFLTRYDRSFFHNFRKFTEPVIAALAAMGVAAELTGRNDIVVDGRKISGNAQYASGPRMLSHGTLLLDSRLESVVEALNVKTEKIASKGLKSIRSRVANISEFLESPVSMADFKARLVQSIFAPLGGAQERPLAESDWRAVHQLAAEKYGSWDWNFGRSPAYNIQRVHRFSLGRIDARVDVAKGRIQAIRIFGDFIGMGEIAELEDRLRGKSYRKDALRAALCEVDLSRYFGDISQTEFLDFLVPN